MQVSNTTTQDGMFEEIDRICGSNTVSYPLKAKASRINQGIDHFFSIALMYDKSWQYDDINQVDLPIASASLKNGQQDYPFALELLTAKGVFVKDTAGILHELTQPSQDDPQNVFLLPSRTNGVPTKFKLLGNSILLDPIPNYDMPSGLKVSFGRNGTKITDADTTKVIGIPSLFHPWICQYASFPYLIEKRLPQKNDIALLIAQGEQSIMIYLSKRNATKKARMIPMREDNR